MRGICHSRGQLLMPRISEFENILRGGVAKDCNLVFFLLWCFCSVASRFSSDMYWFRLLLIYIFHFSINMLYCDLKT